jgi:hypothetical protein
MLENEKLKAIEEIEGTNKTEEDKKEMAHIDGLFCGLHIKRFPLQLIPENQSIL